MSPLARRSSSSRRAADAPVWLVRRLFSRNTGVRGIKGRGSADRVTAASTPTGLDQLWVADITYVRTWRGWLYVAVDTYRRRVVGWSMRDDLHTELVVDALQMAVWRRERAAELVHHSDRGSQYTSWAIGRTLGDSGILL